MKSSHAADTAGSPQPFELVFIFFFLGKTKALKKSYAATPCSYWPVVSKPVGRVDRRGIVNAWHSCLEVEKRHWQVPDAEDLKHKPALSNR